MQIRLTNDRHLLGVLAAIGLGLILRLINLSTEPYWGDEVLSLDIVRHFSSIPQMLTYLREVEFHPPLFYILLHYWTNWFGASEFAVKTLSVIFGLATIPLVYTFSKKIFQNKNAALLAAIFVAVLPIQVEYSQEARPYIIFTFFGILQAYYTWLFIQTKDKKFLAGFVLAGIIGMYLHYSFIFIWAACACWWFVQVLLEPAKLKSKSFIVWLMSQGIVLLGFSYWLSALLYKIDLGKYPIFGLARSYSAVRESWFFESIVNRIIWLSPIEQQNVVTIIISVLARVLIIAIGLYTLSKIKNWKSLGESQRKVSFVACLFIIPLILFILSPYSVAYTDIIERHVLFVSIPFVLALGFIISKLDKKWASTAAIVFILSLVPYQADVVGNDAQWNSQYQLDKTASFANLLYQEGDILIISSAQARTNLNHYLRPELSAIPLLPTNYYGGDFLSSRETLGIIENEYQTRQQRTTQQEIAAKLDNLNKLYKPKRIWLAGVPPNEYRVHKWFLENNWVHRVKPISNTIYLDLYAK
jgi:uncharacterized membrane protein